MGQVNVALVAQEYLNDGGSITLTSGIVAEQPIRFGAAASMTNAAVEGFVRGAAIELARGVRINAVSPTRYAQLREHGRTGLEYTHCHAHLVHWILRLVLGDATAWRFNDQAADKVAVPDLVQTDASVRRVSPP